MIGEQFWQNFSLMSLYAWGRGYKTEILPRRSGVETEDTSEFTQHGQTFCGALAACFGVLGACDLTRLSGHAKA